MIWEPRGQASAREKSEASTWRNRKTGWPSLEEPRDERQGNGVFYNYRFIDGLSFGSLNINSWYPEINTVFVIIILSRISVSSIHFEAWNIWSIYVAVCLLAYTLRVIIGWFIISGIGYIWTLWVWQSTWRYLFLFFCSHARTYGIITRTLSCDLELFL